MKATSISVQQECPQSGLHTNSSSKPSHPAKAYVSGTPPIPIPPTKTSDQSRFTYVDTLKILQKWGPGCHFYGYGSSQDLDELEQLLESGEKVLSLFCEFPSNPLLGTPDLKRIRQMADKYDFAVVVDETIGNFINIAVLDCVDIVVSSLTKIFSGASNVMGGRCRNPFLFPVNR